MKTIYVTDLQKNMIIANETFVICSVEKAEDKNGKAYVIEVNRGPGIDYEPDRPNEIEALAKFFSSFSSPLLGHELKLEA